MWATRSLLCAAARHRVYEGIAQRVFSGRGRNVRIRATAPAIGAACAMTPPYRGWASAGDRGEKHNNGEEENEEKDESDEEVDESDEEVDDSGEEYDDSDEEYESDGSDVEEDQEKKPRKKKLSILERDDVPESVKQTVWYQTQGKRKEKKGRKKEADPLDVDTLMTEDGRLNLVNESGEVNTELLKKLTEKDSKGVTHIEALLKEAEPPSRLAARHLPTAAAMPPGARPRVREGIRNPFGWKKPGSRKREGAVLWKPAKDSAEWKMAMKFLEERHLEGWLDEDMKVESQWPLPKQPKPRGRGIK